MEEYLDQTLYKICTMSTSELLQCAVQIYGLGTAVYGFIYFSLWGIKRAWEVFKITTSR